ncbi:VG15 protein [Amycolatopsis kentuckyensis]|uniref:VG15 protein n=1 Tax=Amycolatopsis kentuckyensis TaxID=218823 RepID=UPI003567EE9A
MAETTAGLRLTQRYRNQQLALRAEFLQQLHKAWPLLDPFRLDATARAWLDLMIDLITGFWSRSVTVSLAYYEAFRKAETDSAVFHTSHLRDVVVPNLDQIRAVLIATGPAKIKHDTIAGDHNMDTIARNAMVEVSGAASRLVLNGGRDAIDEAVHADRRAVGYARVLGPRPCYWCAMLASRGPVYRSEDVALRATERSKRAGKEYHDHCMCQAEPVFRHLKRDDWPEHIRDLADLWSEAKKDASGRKTINVFRTLFEARGSVEIPAQRTTR